MSKKYHLDVNEVAFLHCMNGAFAGLYAMLEMLSHSGKKFTKQRLIKVVQDTVAQTNTALSSEYIRGELLKKGVIDAEDDVALCTFDPSQDNDSAETEVFSRDDLTAKRMADNEPIWVSNIKGK